MEIDENNEYVSQETWETYSYLDKELKIRDEKLQNTIGKIVKIANEHFNDIVGFFPDQVVDDYCDLLDSHTSYLEKQITRLKIELKMFKEIGVTEKVHKIMIECRKEDLKDVGILQCSADNLLGRCIEYTQKSAAA